MAGGRQSRGATASHLLQGSTDATSSDGVTKQVEAGAVGEGAMVRWF